MREILFRGRCFDGSGWIEGDYLTEDAKRLPSGQSWILPKDEYEEVKVETKTVGQFTGLFDKNGKKIFEGDIIRAVGNNNPALTYTGAVVYRETSFFIEEHNEWYSELHSFKKVVMYNDMQASAEIEYTLEVIGNIHDNPELWKEGEA